MSINLFSDIIDALGKVGAGIKAISDMPRKEREKYRQVLGDTYRLIDTTLNMVILRLGDIYLKEKDEDFLREVICLDNFSDWVNAEREFRICSSLRATRRDADRLTSSLPGQLSVADWEALLQQMDRVLQTEGEVADFIRKNFHDFSESARKLDKPDAKDISKKRGEVRDLKNSLDAEHQKLIRQEIELFDIV